MGVVARPVGQLRCNSMRDCGQARGAFLCLSVREVMWDDIAELKPHFSLVLMPLILVATSKPSPDRSCQIVSSLNIVLHSALRPSRGNT